MNVDQKQNWVILQDKLSKVNNRLEKFELIDDYLSNILNDENAVNVMSKRGKEYILVAHLQLIWMFNIEPKCVSDTFYRKLLFIRYMDKFLNMNKNVGDHWRENIISDDYLNLSDNMTLSEIILGPDGNISSFIRSEIYSNESDEETTDNEYSDGDDEYRTCVSHNYNLRPRKNINYKE